MALVKLDFCCIRVCIKVDYLMLHVLVVGSNPDFQVEMLILCEPQWRSYSNSTVWMCRLINTFVNFYGVCE